MINVPAALTTCEPRRLSRGATCSRGLAAPRRAARRRCLEHSRPTSVGRYYDPATGQFLTVDPLVDETGQPYAYTGGDPVDATDPTGRFFQPGRDSMACSDPQVAAYLFSMSCLAPPVQPNWEQGLEAAIFVAPFAALGPEEIAADGILEGLDSPIAAEADNGVAIGEDMANRVQPYADRVGADTYQPDSTAPESQWEQNQRDWINKQMDNGRKIFDCGPSPNYPNYSGISSPWYSIERQEIANRNYPVTVVDC